MLTYQRGALKYLHRFVLQNVFQCVLKANMRFQNNMTRLTFAFSNNLKYLKCHVK